MIRINNIILSLSEDMVSLESEIAKKLKIKKDEIKSFNIYKESIDARRKDVKLIYTIDVSLNDKQKENKITKLNKIDISLSPDNTYTYVNKGTQKLNNRPVVVGFGPSGMFCALILAQMGYKPIVLERGEEVSKRTQDVFEFWTKGKLKNNSNVQFGEGGAGTFSDGKLTTRIKDEIRCLKVLNEFVNNGAPEDIIYKQKAHIGTDILKKVVMSLRNKIIDLGGEIRFNSCVTDLIASEGSVKEIVVNNSYTIKTDILALCIGHSARDTYYMLYKRGITFLQKPFAVGVRIEHPQKLINLNQYKQEEIVEKLGAADYKLTGKAQNGRGVYSFCMCPGGEVIGAASENGMLVTNGMSYHSRNGENANSALLVSVNTEDYGSSHPLAGIEFQRNIEKNAFIAGGSDYKAPYALVNDFIKDKVSASFGQVKPTYMAGVRATNYRNVLPEFIVSALKDGIKQFDSKIRGFAMEDAILTGVETRSSAPVRIPRDESMMASIKGTYVVGEGAGYSGGIISSAVDGIKCAEKIAEVYGSLI